MIALIHEMRLVRKDKYRLLFKFVQHFFWKQGLLDAAFRTDLVFGSFMPTDLKTLSVA
jgi:hypothetical protein